MYLRNRETLVADMCGSNGGGFRGQTSKPYDMVDTAKASSHDLIRPSTVPTPTLPRTPATWATIRRVTAYRCDQCR